MATKKVQPNGKEHESLEWIVVLQRKGNNVRVQPDWRSAMKIGDSVKFLSPNGQVHVEFEPDKGMLCPFGEKNKKIKNKKPYTVINRSGGVMQCTIVTRSGLAIGYEPREAAAKKLQSAGKAVPPDKNAGSRYCTGGAC